MTTAVNAEPRIAERTLARLARVVFLVSAVLLACSVAAAVALLAGGHDTPRNVLPDVGIGLATFVFSIVGIVIARRHPRSAVAWVLLGSGFAWVLSGCVWALGSWALLGPGGPGRETAVVYAGLVDAWLWIPCIVPLGTLLLLLFPDGHPPTPRWRLWGWFCGATMTLAAIVIMFSPGPIDSAISTAANPLGVGALAHVEFLTFLPLLGIPVGIVGCAVALILRYRRSSGAQRLQLKWLTAAAGTVAALFSVTMLASIPFGWGGADVIPLWVSVLQNLSLASFLLIPIAVGIAITRHRLYDIDRLINRALVYGSVSALLIIVYALSVVGAGNALRAVTGSEQGNLAVAASTLAVAALFRPFRARVQGFIDRRFYRGKYDAAQTVEAFSARLRQETDLTRLSDQLRGVVMETVQPDNVTLWIAGDR